ncbi:general stress protein [Mastigocladopsis repens]|uniref:general stress protein n=1 Tax=Mastigocladopsis repens TaxID=221287 RepID=UPI0002D3609E|nr:general stress protein [Mastigocladopsis repens]
MVVSNQKHAVGVFASRKAAEQALNELKDSGFPMEKVSIIAKDVDQGEQLANAEMTSRVGDENVNTATGVVADTLTASTWGSVLVGLSSLALPGLGVVLAAGSLGVALATSIGGVAVGAAATHNVVKALADLGIPEERARHYSDRLHQGNFMVIVDGSDEEIQRAEAVLRENNIEYWGIYDSPTA